MNKKVVESAETGAAENAAPATVENEDQKIEEMMTFKLNQPFKYDGEEITKLDLSGLLDLNAHDLVDIDREMTRRGFTGTRTELTRQYAMLVAARCVKKPWDYCDRMSARDSIRLKEYVVTFFYATV